jgi:hypothetical protein
MKQGNKAEDHLRSSLIWRTTWEMLWPLRGVCAGREDSLREPWGMLHRKGPGSEEGEGYFCGYLDDEVWHHLKNYLKKRRRVATTGDASRLGIYQIRSP